jgi:hypothetical protein
VRLWSRLWRCAVGEESIALWERNGNTVSGSMRSYILFRLLIQVKVSVCLGDMSKKKYRAVPSAFSYLLLFYGELRVMVNSKALGDDILRAL